MRYNTRNCPGTLGAVSHKIDRPYHLSWGLFPTLYSLSLSQSCQNPESHPDLPPSPLLNPSIIRLRSLGHSPPHAPTPCLPGPGPPLCVLSPAAKESFSNCKSDYTAHVLETHLWLPAHWGQNQSPPCDWFTEPCTSALSPPHHPCSLPQLPPQGLRADASTWAVLPPDVPHHPPLFLRTLAGWHLGENPSLPCPQARLCPLPLCSDPSNMSFLLASRTPTPQTVSPTKTGILVCFVQLPGPSTQHIVR